MNVLGGFLEAQMIGGTAVRLPYVLPIVVILIAMLVRTWWEIERRD